jgi:hypothetical protein
MVVSKSGRGPLPGKTTDLARDGLRPRDLSRNNLYRAACAVALSAINSGWTFVDFDALLAERGSALGNQIRSGGRGRPDQTPREVRRLLRRAWTSAERKIAASPPHAPVEEVKAVVADVRARVPSLSPPFDVVMSCWADAAEQHVTLTPVFPIRVLAACARLTLTTAGRALTAVRDARLLRCVEHGEARPGGHASRYSLGPAWPDPGVKYALGESDAMEPMSRRRVGTAPTVTVPNPKNRPSRSGATTWPTTRSPSGCASGLGRPPATRCSGMFPERDAIAASADEPLPENVRRLRGRETS